VDNQTVFERPCGQPGKPCAVLQQKYQTRLIGTAVDWHRCAPITATIKADESAAPSLFHHRVARFTPAIDAIVARAMALHRKLRP
jgi:hypothetical protein